MSGRGQKRTSQQSRAMSALPPKADITKARFRKLTSWPNRYSLNVASMGQEARTPGLTGYAIRNKREIQPASHRQTTEPLCPLTASNAALCGAIHGVCPMDTRLLHQFDKELTVEYRGETYRARDNGSMYRERRPNKRKRPHDGIWTFGSFNASTGYMQIGTEVVHRIIATAFYG